MKAALVLSVAASALVMGAAPARAQQPRRGWEPRGFDFTPDGVWRLRARRVAQLRRQALARGDFALLNQAIGAARASGGAAPGTFQMFSAAGATTAVTGVLRIPALLVNFKGVTPKYDTAAYDQVLFGKNGTAVPLYSGRPYSVRTFYEELSHGMMSVQGVVVGWLQLDTTEAYFAGAGTCDGLCGTGNMRGLLYQAFHRADSLVDFSQFDQSGTGQVDLVWLIKPTIGAECGVDGVIWAHRYYYSAWSGTGPYVTKDTTAVGNPVTIDNYTIQGGVGGATACDSTAIMPPGTIAHETGHGLDLPDLYDVTLASEGIGHWGLMGSGNYARPFNPAHMEAWSLLQLGWVALAPLTAAGSYALSPVESSDTVAVVRPSVANPRGEYFLLENRRAIGSDSGLIDLHAHGVGGLLVWHVDSTRLVGCNIPSNCVNTYSPHGVHLIEADQVNELDAGTNRGDGGDVFPGDSGRTTLSYATAPAALLNATGLTAGFELDSIHSISPNGPMGFTLKFGTLLALLDSASAPAVMGTAYADTIKVGGGIGSYAFTVATGALPPGLTLGSSSGIIAGVPAHDSTYAAGIRVTSGGETLSVAVQIIVTAPSLALDSVVTQYLLGGSRLTSDQLRYLDLNGNSNNLFDIGDVVAWLDKTGQSKSAAVMSRVLRRLR